MSEFMFEDEPYSQADIQDANEILKGVVNRYDSLVWHFGSVSEIDISKKEVDAIRIALKIIRDYGKEG